MIEGMTRRNNFEASSRARALFRGISTSYAGTTINVVLNIIATPIILYALGASRYGIWCILLQVQSYFGMLDFGLTIGSVRTLSISGVAHGRPDPGTLRHVLRLYMRISLLILLVGPAVSLALPHVLPIENVRPVEVSTGFCVMTLGSALLMPLSTATDYLMAKQRLGLFNGLLLLRSVVEVGSGIGLVMLGFGIVGLAVAQVLAGSIVYLVACQQMVKEYGWRVLWYAPNEPGVSQEVWQITKLTFLQKMSALVARNGDGVLIGFVLGPTAVTIYLLTFRLIATAVSLVGRATPLMLPGLSEVWGLGGAERCNAIYRRVSRVIFVTLLAVGALAASLDREFVSLWIGAGNCGSTILIWALASVAVLTTFGSVPQVILTSANRLKTLTVGCAAEAALKVGLGLILLKVIGLSGLALASLVAWVIGCGMTGLGEVTKALKQPMLSLLWETMIGPGLLFGIPAACVVVLAINWVATTWTGLMGKGFVMMLSLLICGLLLEWRWGDWSYCYASVRGAPRKS